MSLFDRHRQIEIEEASQAAYALRSQRSVGRKYRCEPHPLRTEFQRDRDRVIHCRAFRRLEYKTQVFVVGTADDHFRTRLTHTIEVAGIARTVARSLGVNEDLAETIALAHDLGHTPFGHCGERELNRLMTDHGGFDHNLQALRVVDQLEDKYPGTIGLNLTWETRCGLLKHRAPGMTLDGKLLPDHPSLESQVADVADDATYLSHDVDDGISAGLIGEEELKHLSIWQRARERLTDPSIVPGHPTYYPIMVRNLIDLQVADIVTTSAQRLEDAGVDSPEAADQWPTPLIGFSDGCRADCRELRAFLHKQVYWHPSVDNDNQSASRMMAELFQYLLEHQEDLGRKARNRIGQDGLELATADHIAGMTDQFAIKEYHRLVGQSSAD